MCGIWAFEGKPSIHHLSKMIIKADERGGHGYGFYGITKNNEHKAFYAHGRADVGLLLDVAQDCVIGIGHSRLVTSGDKQLHNAQPVLNRNIAMVHNGNVKNYKGIDKEYKYNRRTALDSESLIPLIKNEKLYDSDIEGVVVYILFKDTKHALGVYQKGDYPLFKHSQNNTNYYCSKQWVQ